LDGLLKRFRPRCFLMLEEARILKYVLAPPADQSQVKCIVKRECSIIQQHFNWISNRFKSVPRRIGKCAFWPCSPHYTIINGSRLTAQCVSPMSLITGVAGKMSSSACGGEPRLMNGRRLTQMRDPLTYNITIMSA
jgi:hypothetical protein